MRIWAAIVAALSLLPGVASGDGAGAVPPGSGWWCMDMPGATGMCERSRAACVADIASMPWGGLPPPCVARSQAHCATYSAGAATSPPSARWLCRRDVAGCAEALTQVRAQHPPPEVVSAAACRASR